MMYIDIYSNKFIFAFAYQNLAPAKLSCDQAS